MGTKVWITSDLHLGHKNIIAYCDRPFTSVEDMDKTLIARWNEYVRGDDIVWFLGDFGLGDKEKLGSYACKLNGRKFLVKGNHDTKSNQFYLDIGFERVYDKSVIVDEDVILSHRPIGGNLGKFYNFYGHVHDDRTYPLIGERNACVCVERWEYAPVEFAKLKKAVMEGAFEDGNN